MAKPVINYKKCTACGTCIEICPMNVFAKEKGKDKTTVKDPDACIGCNLRQALIRVVHAPEPAM